MRTTVALNITNLNNTSYPTILFRKFFNMVFVKPNGKELSIYTGTVFCGSDDKETTQTGKNVPSPSYTQNSGCTLEFLYTVSNDTGDPTQENGSLIKSISFCDLTDSYMKQPQWVEKVWGDVKILSTQQEFEQELRHLYPNHYPEQGEPLIPDVLTVGNAVRIEDRFKGNSHSCIACKGAYLENPTEKDRYTLTNDVAIGVEAINWIKTTIKLKKSILDDNNKIKFKVYLGNASGYCTPDFTWYFAPPPNYVVDPDAATLRIGNEKEERQKVMRVPDATTVYFDEWLKRETIKERAKSRVEFGGIIKEDYYKLSGKEILITVSFTNPGKHGNLQFFIGLIVAFLLSFCSDKTRLNDFLSACEPLICSCEPCKCSIFGNALGILFPVLVILAFFSLLFTKKRCLPETRWYEWSIYVIKWIGLLAALALIAYIYIGWLVFPEVLCKIAPSCGQNQKYIWCFLLASIACNAVYVSYCIFGKKKNIVDFF